jgi:topoisomerase IA-like protein
LESDIVKYSGTVVDLRMDNESLTRNLNRAVDVLADQESHRAVGGGAALVRLFL